MWQTVYDELFTQKVLAFGIVIQLQQLNKTREKKNERNLDKLYLIMKQSNYENCTISESAEKWEVVCKVHKSQNEKLEMKANAMTNATKHMWMQLHKIFHARNQETIFVNQTQQMLWKTLKNINQMQHVLEANQQQQQLKYLQQK